jgi:hypothetical protein
MDARRTTRSGWLVAGALVALSVIPVVAGATRLAGLAGGAKVTAENARFFAAPVPVVLHIVGATFFCVLGALQFAPRFRRLRPAWHRGAGKVLFLCGLTAALTGLWMTLSYPRVPGEVRPSTDSACCSDQPWRRR